MIFNEIKCHVNTSLGLVGGCIPCIPPCVRACDLPCISPYPSDGPPDVQISQVWEIEFSW